MPITADILAVYYKKYFLKIAFRYTRERLQTVVIATERTGEAIA